MVEVSVETYPLANRLLKNFGECFLAHLRGGLASERLQGCECVVSTCTTSALAIGWCHAALRVHSVYTFLRCSCVLVTGGLGRSEVCLCEAGGSWEGGVCREERQRTRSKLRIVKSPTQHKGPTSLLPEGQQYIATELLLMIQILHQFSRQPIPLPTRHVNIGKESQNVQVHLKS